MCVSFFILVQSQQGPQKRSGCSGFGRTSFTQGKNEIQFLKKQVLNKSASVIFGIVRLIILSYNR